MKRLTTASSMGSSGFTTTSSWFPGMTPLPHWKPSDAAVIRESLHNSFNCSPVYGETTWTRGRAACKPLCGSDLYHTVPWFSRTAKASYFCRAQVSCSSVESHPFHLASTWKLTTFWNNSHQVWPSAMTRALLQVFCPHTSSCSKVLACSSIPSGFKRKTKPVQTVVSQVHPYTT